MEEKETKFIDLGQRGYREVWKMQEQFLEEVKEKKLKGQPFHHYLLFVEHTPVYTIGKSGDTANMLMNSTQLSDKQVEFIKVDRGGDITFHGPGQLVVYPILDLESLHLSVKEYVERLEEVVIRTLSHYHIQGERLTGATGVWLEVNTSCARKICAIGVKCSRYVTMHGFALNVSTDLEYFNNIHPCGFVDKGVTSIQKEIGEKVNISEIRKKVFYYFESVFGLNIKSRE